MVEFNNKIKKQFELMCEAGKLFKVEMTGRDVWHLYLDSFESDPTFRDPESSTHNCNLCNNFLRRYGNVVAISEDYKLMTLFDFEIEGEYAEVARALSAAIKASKVKDIFLETYSELNELPYGKINKADSKFRLGLAENHKRYTREEAEKFGVVKTDETRKFNHLHLDLPKEFVDMRGGSIESIMAEFREPKSVFKRAMDEIPLGTLNLVKDLIVQRSLLDGETHLYKVEQFIPLKREYDDLSADSKDNWCWVKSHKLPFAKFKNELIGVLCSELAEGEEINKACQSWNKRVDPANYMKAVAPITQRQKDDARKFIEENEYVESFDRRFASIDDIKASEILHMSVGKDAIKNVSMFDSVKTVKSQHKRNEFDGVEEVSIEKFMKDVLPGCSSVEVFLKNNHEGNMVSLTTSNVADSKPIFKWKNNYSWTFNGNLAGKSQIKEAVKSAGGRVDGILRASMIWNESLSDNSDLDLWCQQPNNEKIGFSTGFRKDQNNRLSSCSGQLDLDNTGPGNKIGVENIYFSDQKRMKDGVYKFWVNQYSARNSQGFKFEIEFDGEIFTYEYNRPVSGNVQVAEVTLNNGQFSIKHMLPETASSKEIYGLETNQFHKVNLVCLSPNHWDGDSVGNKHYFFMLDGCKTVQSIRSFHNENLIPELAEHRKVLEALGATNMIEPISNGILKQLSGLGFNATVNDELIVKLSGNFKRVVKIKF